MLSFFSRVNEGEESGKFGGMYCLIDGVYDFVVSSKFETFEVLIFA